MDIEITKEVLEKLINEGNNFKNCMNILNISSRKLKYYRKLYGLSRIISDIKEYKQNCKNCGKIVLYQSRNKKEKVFCNRSCANTRKHSNETKISIKNSILKKTNKPIRFCKNCNIDITYKRKSNIFCSKKCASISFSKSEKGKLHFEKIGKISANKICKRSKNEIMFYNKCIKYFNNVEHNISLFNGWDADIIIHDVKIAVLWNGKWHYEYIRGNQSLKQIKNRDKIKIKEIENYGYEPYIIKDMGKYSISKVEEEFDKFILYITKK